MPDSGQLRMLITGGGTGGHLFPAVAAAQAMKKRLPESKILFIGTRRKIDTTGLAQYGFESCAITSHGLKGKKPAELIRALATLPVSFGQAYQHIRRFRPDVALGVGGYVTGPVMAAARFAGVGTVIHEQNSVPGMANRKLGRIVDKVCTSIPGSEKYFPTEKVVFTGNPVRQDILELARRQKVERAKSATLLVLGGSQGAHAINRLVVDIFGNDFAKSAGGLKLIHQTGTADYEWVAEVYRKNRVDAEVAPFFRDMAEVYAKADFLVSRAGATTLAELAVLGKPAILIPYPHAADNHQMKNAQYYTDGGGTMMFRQDSGDGDTLGKAIAELATDNVWLDDMAVSMRDMGIQDAAERLVDCCLDVASRVQ